jgi:hypothetical protein
MERSWERPQRLTEFTRYYRTKAIELEANPEWDDIEEALRQASPNDMHKFLNWCLKLQYNPDDRRLRGIKKFSALDEDWKYFRVYYTKVCDHGMCKEMGDAVRTVCSSLLAMSAVD